MSRFEKALRSFDAHAFVRRHGGHKESASIHSYEYLLRCPRCGSSNLRWNSQKGTWICWGCKLTGSTMLLIQLFERCDEVGAVEYVLGGYVGGDSKIDSLETLIRSPYQPALSRPPKLSPRPWPEGVDLLMDPSDAPHARAWAYLRSRGVTPEMAREFGLGYGRSGRLSGYVVFPCYIGGDLLYYQGRATWDPPAGIDRKVWIEETHYRKTLNPFSGDGLASAADALVGYDVAKGQHHIVVVEGPFDAIKIGAGAVGLLGKAITEQKILLLSRLGAHTYTIYLDRGKEESEAARKLAGRLSAFGEVFLAQPPEGRDAGDLTRAQNAAVLKRAERFRPGSLVSALS